MDQAKPINQQQTDRHAGDEMTSPTMDTGETLNRLTANPLSKQAIHTSSLQVRETLLK